VTAGEDKAIESLIEAWAEMNQRHGRIVDRTKNAWFRSLVHTLAAQAGIDVKEPASSALDTPASNEAAATKGSKD
jgi:hypothetical protein